MSFYRFVNRLRAINLPWSSKKFVGYDLQGNMYFQEPSQRSGVTAPRRSVIYSDGTYHHFQYDPNTLPVQWQAWMRHTRELPPTLEELHEDLNRQAILAEKIKKLEESERELREAIAAPKSSNPQEEHIEAWLPNKNPQ